MPLRDGGKRNRAPSSRAKSIPAALDSSGAMGRMARVPPRTVPRRSRVPASLNGRFPRTTGRIGHAVQRCCSTIDLDARVYYHERREAFYLPRKPKQFWPSAPNYGGWTSGVWGAGFVRLCAREPFTVRGVQVLPPGSAWTFRPGAFVQKDAYFKAKGVGSNRRRWNPRHTMKS